MKKTQKIPVAHFSEEDDFLLEQMWYNGYIGFCEEGFSLKCGGQSHVFIGVRDQASDNATRASLLVRIGTKIIRTILDARDEMGRRGKLLKVPRLIGVAEAGNTLAEATALMAAVSMLLDVRYIPTRSRSRKGRWIDAGGGSDFDDWLIENATTTGGSIERLMKRIGRQGFRGSDISLLIFVDRDQGALERLREQFKQVIVCYYLHDLAIRYGPGTFNLKLWSNHMVRKVLAEM
ncbi:MAG: hypothetical protein ABH833_01925 [Parcubacteria group bacterium]